LTRSTTETVGVTVRWSLKERASAQAGRDAATRRGRAGGADAPAEVDACGCSAPGGERGLALLDVGR